MSANARIKREGIFFITGAKWRFQKIDQREGERKRANKEGTDIFYNRSEVEVSKKRPKRKVGADRHQGTSGSFFITRAKRKPE